MSDIHESTATEQPRQRILVVEDNKALRLHACAVLDTFGFDVCQASSGEQALQLLNRVSVDAVLLDVRMPGMDGFETCRGIRTLQGCESLPVIVTTGLDDHQAVDAAFDAGASDFVIKPINWPILKRRILSTINARVTAQELAANGDDRRGLLNTLRDAVLRLDSDGRVLHTRLPDESWDVGDVLFPVGQHLPVMLPKATRGVARTAIAAIREGQNQARFEFAIDFDSGTRSYEVDLAPGGRGEIVALVRDCTERYRAEARIRQLAYYDGVTGLPNREMLQLFVDEKLNDGRHAGRCVTVMRLEVKGLEDTRSLLGNQRADDLLRLCADRLRHSVGVQEDLQPEVRTLVGRTGDAGFAIVRDDLRGDETLRSVAECLQDAMTGSYSLDGYEINTTARLGIATSGEQSSADATDLFDQADMALAQSQLAPAFFSSRTRDQRREKARLLNELQCAVSNGDLHLEYQPKVAAGSRQLLGVEALVRWNHPSRGVVPPGQFIPLAEENGLILPIGEYVFAQACRQSQQWTRAGRQAMPIAVNFSGHQFIQQGLVKTLIGTLADCGLGKGAIEIELTETVAMEQCAGIHRVLQELHDIGIHTALDDFGTGYSSLDNLRQFKYHTLKIDRSFVADLGHNPTARSLIGGIIRMSHSLGMQVVAEGVEEEHQLDYLHEQRCDLIQGYLTGRPTTAATIEGMLQRIAA